MIGRSKGRSCTPSRCSRRHFEFLYNTSTSFWQPHQTIWRSETLNWFEGDADHPHLPGCCLLWVQGGEAQQGLTTKVQEGLDMTLQEGSHIQPQTITVAGGVGGAEEQLGGFPPLLDLPFHPWQLLKRLFVFGKSLWGNLREHEKYIQPWLVKIVCSSFFRSFTNDHGESVSQCTFRKL